MLDLLPAGLPVPAAGLFTTRAGGISPPPWDALNLALHVQDDPSRVRANRVALAGAAGLVPGRLVWAEQVHGAGVAVVDRAPGRDADVPGVDALVTATPGLGLLVLAADCLPVLLADPQAGVVAAAHAGRAGLATGVLQETLRAMQQLGARPDRVHAVLGPAVCGRCYEVPAALAEDVGARVPGSRATTRQGTPALDLSAGARAVLQGCGVQVSAVGGCTLEQARFFSYRRDGRTGRHAGLVQLAA